MKSDFKSLLKNDMKVITFTNFDLKSNLKNKITELVFKFFEHDYMRLEVSSNRFEIANRYKNLFCSHEYLASSSCHVK